MRRRDLNWKGWDGFMNKRISIFGHMLSLTWGDLCVVFVMIAFGLLLIVWPDAIREYILVGIGALLMLSGAVQLIRYFRATGAERMTQNGFVLGLFEIVAGLEVILARKTLSELLIFIFAIALIVVAAYYVQGLMNIRHMKSDKWKFALAAGIVSLCCGISLLAFPNMFAMTDRPNATMVVVGIMLAAQGILFLIFRIQYHRIFKKWIEQAEI